MFEVDPFWPKPMPNNWVFGQTIGLGIDEKDQVWIIHRGNDPGNLDRTEYALPPAPAGAAAAARAAPRAGGRRAAPATTRPARTGSANAAIRRRRSWRSIRPATSSHSWGGPALHPEWPDSNHGIVVDHKGNVWIGGNGGPDAHILKFTRDGKFVGDVRQEGRAHGRRQAAVANTNDMDDFGRVAKIFIDPKANEAYVADGYFNKRVAVIDMDSGKIKRYWGGYGNKPDDAAAPLRSEGAARRSSSARRCTAPRSRTTASSTCAIARTIASRCSRRKASSSRRSSSSPRRCRTARCGTSRSRRDPQQQFLYMADGANEHVYIIDRQSLEVLSQFGTGGRQPGMFLGVHSIAVDSKGNIYTTETYTGKRLQKFVYKGMGAAQKGVPWPTTK